MNKSKRPILFSGGTLFTIVILLSISINMSAQKSVKLWEGNPPTSNNITEAEQYNQAQGWVTNVSSPELSIYLPDKANNTGMAVLVCPGGGYAGLAINHEGIDIAKWLNKQGIAGVILKYRMPNKHKEIPLDDAQQAMRYIRKNAKELGINPNKVGVAGFSAGGHLAATLSTHFATDGVSTRPDFSILFYPVVTMKKATHGGSRTNLLGDNPTTDEIEFYSNEAQVKENTPPAILLLSDDDTGVVPANSVGYYEALKKYNVPATMYIFPEGGHGWGMRENFKYHTQMLDLLGMWLKDMQHKLK
ncbi:MAG: alpha/beta hydrolase [Dysgonomonas sp.]